MSDLERVNVEGAAALQDKIAHPYLHLIPITEYRDPTRRYGRHCQMRSQTRLSTRSRLPTQPPFFSGPEKPCRFEAEVYNCSVRGIIPPQIDGTYYRCMHDPQWAPLYSDDVFINGDGAIDAIRIQNGHADFKQKFVRTEKFVIERAARQSVFGKYRNR